MFLLLQLSIFQMIFLKFQVEKAKQIFVSTNWQEFESEHNRIFFQQFYKSEIEFVNSFEQAYDYDLNIQKDICHPERKKISSGKN